jgi:hypothetical protein
MSALHSPLKTLADNGNPTSLASRMRRKRFDRFVSLLDRLDGRVSILDVGGTAEFWTMMGFNTDRIDLTLLNMTPAPDLSEGMRSVVGDARDLRGFRDREFDVVFSNSVIEHVGSYADQRHMASEVRRVGRNYWIQTPNKYFPVEPHFLVPGFQFLPVSLRASFLARYNLGWYKRAKDYATALDEVTAVRLLTSRELRALFPEANLYRERFFGWTKSLVVHYGFD